MASSAGNGPSSLGGDQAGQGTAELVPSKSEPLEATRDGMVNGVRNGEGDSTFRSIEGGARTEEATRSRQTIVAEFLAVEEQALDEQSLPLSRRKHIIRYFSGVRQEFENDQGEP